MKQRLLISFIIVAAVVVTALITAFSPAVASSHREAPGIASTPAVDATDFYMFRSYEPGRDGFVTLLANYIPLPDPYGGPNYFSLDPDAIYQIHITNNGDLEEDITFRFQVQIELTTLNLNVGGESMDVPLVNVGPFGAGLGDDALGQQRSFSLQLIRGNVNAPDSIEFVTNVSGGATRFGVPNRLASTGTSEPTGFSNNKAGPPARKVRSQISVISNLGSTGMLMRFSSPCFSSWVMKSRRSLYFIYVCEM